ncbi:putative adenylyl-sulfate kinase [Abditibacteriota bacterium]|nr:putative adenylyl-sulfate kinase [Abditibacteriota bacterium]
MSAHQGFTLWFTGLSGAGKSTLSEALEREFRRRNFRVEVLDGDIVRTHLSKGLGFSKEDRDTNVLRIGFVCSLLARNGVISVSAAISPYADIRAQCRQMTEESGTAFVEVYMNAPLEVVAARDVKGLYKRAMAGEIPQFTGVSDPYEAPENPEVIVDSGQEGIEASTQKVLAYLEERGLISA